MTPEDWLLDETRGWLSRAGADLRAAVALQAADLPAEALYHCQQAAEKFLKAFLTFHQRPFRKTHDLGELVRVCAELDGSLEANLAPTLDLSPYAWRFRYPGAPYEPVESEVGFGLELAHLVRAKIMERLALAFPQPDVKGPNGS